MLAPLYLQWLNQMKERPQRSKAGNRNEMLNPDDYYRRGGVGVIPLDFPDDSLIDAIIGMNFSRRYAIRSFESGVSLRDELVAAAASHD